MTDFQTWIMSLTAICIYALTLVYSIAKYAIMRSTEKYISASTAKERDQ